MPGDGSVSQTERASKNKLLGWHFRHGSKAPLSSNAPPAAANTNTIILDSVWPVQATLVGPKLSHCSPNQPGFPQTHSVSPSSIPLLIPRRRAQRRPSPSPTITKLPPRAPHFQVQRISIPQTQPSHLRCPPRPCPCDPIPCPSPPFYLQLKTPVRRRSLSPSVLSTAFSKSIPRTPHLPTKSGSTVGHSLQHCTARHGFGTGSKPCG